jgi:hypothetical protein
MPSVTPKGTGVVNIPGPLTRHSSGQIFSNYGTAGAYGSAVPLDWTSFSAWNSSTSSRENVDISGYAAAAVQVFNNGTSTIWISLDGEDSNNGEGSPIPPNNGFQIDMPSAGLSLEVWSAAGGEQFFVRAFIQSVLA